MLKAEEQMELAVLKKHGGSIRGLSRLTGRSRNTVRRYLRGGDEVAKRKPGPRRAEKLDPFKTYIVDRMKAALPDRIPATVLFREIKELGYEGGETRVKLFVRGLTPLPAAAPAVRFETDAWSSDAGGLGDGWARRRQAVAFHCDARVEPPGICRVLRRRAGRDADRLSRDRVPDLWGRAGRGPLRQHENCRYRAEHLWAWRASLPCGVPRLCAARGILAAIVSAISRADER